MKAFARITILTIVVFLLASVHARAQGPAGAERLPLRAAVHLQRPIRSIP